MVKASQRRLKKKFVRVPSGKVVERYSRKLASKPIDALSKKPLQGTARGTKINKLSKTQRRPSVLFGGVLGSKSRDLIFEEAIKVKTNVKTMDDVSISIRKYVKEAILKIEL